MEMRSLTEGGATVCAVREPVVAFEELDVPGPDIAPLDPVAVTETGAMIGPGAVEDMRGEGASGSGKGDSSGPKRRRSDVPR